MSSTTSGSSHDSRAVLGATPPGGAAQAAIQSPSTLSNTHPALRRCWHPVARSADVADRPHRVLLLGEPWVLVRLGSDGELRAFFDRCPHRQAPLSIGSITAPNAGQELTNSAIRVPDVPALRCAYHGWCFNEEGRCIDIPALGPSATIPPKARLRIAHGVVERHGVVFVCPTQPVPGLEAVPAIEEADDPAFMAGDLPVMRAKACAGLLADNFLDMAHFPFVHAATFGAEEPVVTPLEIHRDGWSYTAVSEHPFSNREDPGVAAGTRPLVQRRRVTYRVAAPFHLVLRLDFLDSGGTNVIGFFLQPETEETSRIFSTVWRDDMEGDPGRMAGAVDFEVKVVEEDLAVQEAYDVRALPLDPTVEVHTRADRSTLELRRMLGDLVAAASEPQPSPRHPTTDDRGRVELTSTAIS
jgi:phenylpropionate dioxygenase-like ring-hydroxylating dioxygenase large terminal subunit